MFKLSKNEISDINSYLTHSKPLPDKYRSLLFDDTTTSIAQSISTSKQFKLKEIINTIINGNCISNMALIPDNSIDLIFADPPYYMQTEGELLRTNGEKFDGVEDEWDKFSSYIEYDTFCEQWLKECKRILKPNGSIWIIGAFQNIYHIGYIMQNLGFWILNDVIWSKPNAVPNFSGTRYQNSHETLIWCVKDKKSRYTFNYKTMKYLNGGKIKVFGKLAFA